MKISDDHFNCGDCVVESCIFMQLPKSQLEKIAKNAVSVNIKKGEVIFRQFVPVAHVIHIKKGLVKTLIENVNEHQCIVSIKKQGAILGLRSIIHNILHQYSAVALTDATICYIEKDKFKNILISNLPFSYSILKKTTQESIFLKDKLHTQMVSLLPGKVAKALLYFADDIFASNVFELPLTKVEVAQYVGASRERVTKVLSEFEKEGVIIIKGRLIEILNRKDLIHLCKIG